MATNALLRATSATSLDAAFAHIYSNSTQNSRNSSGVDGQTIAEFASKRSEYISKISREIRSKKFRYQKLSPHFIKKTSGKYRVICVPTIRDRVVQRALNDYLGNRLEAVLNNEISFGFLNNKGVEKAVRTACKYRQNYPWAFKTDISAFFDRIDREKLKEHVRRVVREPSLYWLIDSAIDCEISIETNFAATRIRELGIVPGRGARQGMPLSPMLSNIMLRTFDAKIIKMGYKAVRYADDLIFFGRDKQTCETIFKFCKEELAHEALEIPEISEKSKSIIYTPVEPAEFLGLDLCREIDDTYRLKISAAKIAVIRTELFKLKDIAELNRRGINFFKFGQSLDSRIGGYAAAYDMCENKKEFEAKLESMRSEIYSGVLEQLGIRPKLLNAAAKTFFQI